MIRLESGILEIDNQRFTKEDLLSLSSSNPTSIKIYTISGDSQNHYIPNYSEDNIYTFINLDGSINNSVSIQSDDTGYFVNLSSSVVLIESKNILINNIGNIISTDVYPTIPKITYGDVTSYANRSTISYGTVKNYSNIPIIYYASISTYASHPTIKEVI